MSRPGSGETFRQLAAVALLLLATGCGAGWATVTVPEPRSFSPRRQIQLWVGQRATRLHAVVITRDSVSGIPFLEPVDCDSCRVQFPRSEVDSVRLGNPPAGFWRTLGLVLAGLFVVALAACASGGCSE